jgi:hypothetical protein
MFDVIDKLEELIKYIRDTRGINDRDRIIDIIQDSLNEI